MDSDLFRKQYDFELEQRNSIASATNIPVVAITVAASAASAVLLDFQYQRSTTTYLFLAFSAVTLVAIFLSFYYVFRSFWNYEYKKLPGSLALKQHYDALVEWHCSTGLSPKEAKQSSEEDFLEYINERLADASDWNGQNNIVRGNFLHMATAAVAIAVGALIPGGLIYIYNKATAEDKVHVVRIAAPYNQSPSEAKMATQSGGNNKPAAAPSPAPTPAAKPSGPPNTVFKGNSDMPKPNAGSQSKK